MDANDKLDMQKDIEKPSSKFKESPGEIVKDLRLKESMILEQVYNEQTGETLFAQFSKDGLAYIPNYVKDKETILIPLRKSFFPPLGLPEFDVEPRSIYAEVLSFIKSHVYLGGESSYHIVASYVMATWIYEKFDSFPYLFLLGDFGTGKTRALEVLRLLCHRGLLTPNATPAIIYRIGDEWKPTFLYDETENIEQDVKHEILSIANAGYRKNSCVLRMANGGNDILQFDIYFPKVFAGTRSLPDTLESRCVILRTTEKPADLNLSSVVHEDAAYKLRKKLLGFRLQTLTKDIAYPDINIRNSRTKEIYLPLFFVSPQEYHAYIQEHASMTVSNIESVRSSSLASLLIEIIVRNFGTAFENEGKLFITTIVEKVNFELENEDMKKVRSQDITRLLKEIGLDPAKIYRGNQGFYCIRWDDSFDLWLQEMMRQYIKNDELRIKLETMFFGEGRKESINRIEKNKELRRFREKNGMALL